MDMFSELCANLIFANWVSSVEKCLPNAFPVLCCFKELRGRWQGRTGKHGAFGARHLGPPLGGLVGPPVWVSVSNMWNGHSHSALKCYRKEILQAKSPGTLGNKCVFLSLKRRIHFKRQSSFQSLFYSSRCFWSLVLQARYKHVLVSLSDFGSFLLNEFLCSPLLRATLLWGPLLIWSGAEVHLQVLWAALPRACFHPLCMGSRNSCLSHLHISPEYLHLPISMVSASLWFSQRFSPERQNSACTQITRPPAWLWAPWENVSWLWAKQVWEQMASDAHWEVLWDSICHL